MLMSVSHSAAVAGAAHGRFRRAQRAAEPELVFELLVDGGGPCADTGTPLALTILQIDRGAELLRQQGESPLEKFLEQLSRRCSRLSAERCGGEYTAWSLALSCRYDAGGRAESGG